MSTAAEQGMAVLREVAEDDLVNAVEKASNDGDHTWIYDPDVEGVVGLVEQGTNKAVVIVWLAQKDFEHDHEKLGV